MKKIPKITRAKAIYGVVIDRKTLIEILSENIEFTKHMLQDIEGNINHFIYSKTDRVKDPSLNWAWGEVAEGSEIYIFGREISRMREDETLGHFKRVTEDYIIKILNKEVSCSIFSIPDGVYWS